MEAVNCPAACRECGSPCVRKVWKGRGSDHAHLCRRGHAWTNADYS